MAVASIGVNLKGFGGDIEKIENAIINLQKNLAYLMEHIDSANVRSIDTEKTFIGSGSGELSILGKQIVISNEGTERLKMGVDESGTFTFALYDALGNGLTLNEALQGKGINGKVKTADSKQLTITDGLITEISEIITEGV